MKSKTIPSRVEAHASSWILSNEQVELCLTQEGGQMAPVTFDHRSTTPIQPYYISPWQGEDDVPDEPVLRRLRGDFFCMPFGANEPYRGERHCVHGEPATERWSPKGVVKQDNRTTLTLTMDTRLRPGRVTKEITLLDGHHAVYTRHILSGYTGRLPMGHHATLDAARYREGAMRISTSPLRFRTAQQPE